MKFVGRDEDIEQLHQQLQEKERLAITAVVTGMAGVGKTELALQYALRQKEQSSYLGGICWVQVQQRNVGEQLLDFAKHQLKLTPPEDEDLQQRLGHCWSYWQPPGDVLIVLDDVREYEEIKPYLPPQERRFKVLITTRKHWLSESFEQLRLEVLEEKAALELLEALIGSSRLEAEREEAKRLCQWLGYLPLGLELVGRFLKRRSNWTLARMMQELEQQHLNLPALQEPSGEMTASRGVEATFELTWQELDAQARWLGRFLSLFALADIPWVLVEQCLSQGGNQKKGIMQRWFPTFSRLRSALVPQTRPNLPAVRAWEEVREDSLLSLNLIKETKPETYQLHRLLRQYFRDKLEQMPEAEELKRQFCRGMVVEAKKIPQTPTRGQIETLTLSIPHLAETATEMQQWLEDGDLPWLFIGLGRFYEGQGFYELAEPWYVQCLDVTHSRLGAEHPSVATSLYNLARLYKSQGWYNEAEPLYQQALRNRRKALSMRRKLLEEGHPDMAGTVFDLVGLYEAQGRHSEAKSLYQQALEMRLQVLEMRRKLQGEEHPDVATSLNSLAVLYYYQGRDEEAEALYQQALEMRRKLLGAEHPDVATSLNNLAELYRSQRRDEEAEALYQQALEMRRKLLGEGHPDVVSSLHNLAYLYNSQERYEEAEPLYQQALEIAERVLGEAHPHTQVISQNLYFLYFCCF